ncbi:MAG: hypothetical protein Q8N99_03965 [Nanoarchaeota archaeon]|nr:hypothetical protein [Nanoarchaeota archaeon]
MPESVYLLRNGNIKAMASYNRRYFAGFPSLIVEGICLDPSIQGKKVFEKITDLVIGKECFICLRTQNPRMYKALDNYCQAIFPRFNCFSVSPKGLFLPDFIRSILEEFASYLGCDINDKGVIKGYYRGLFYGEEPKHSTVSEFFKEGLKMDLFKGDAVLAIGLHHLEHFPEDIFEKSGGCW